MRNPTGSRHSYALDQPRTSRERLVFAGVAFELLLAESVRWELPDSYREHIIAPPDTMTIADVICSVSVDRALPPFEGHPLNALTFEREQGRTRVISQQMRAEISAVAPARYAARARLRSPSDEDPAAAVLLGVAAAIVQSEGGLTLHASAVELEGHAVVFLGPSGAGKSTAAALTRGASVFAFDRLSVVARGDRVFAFTMPGGDPIGAPRSAQRCLPVAGLLRVRRGERQSRLAPISAAARLFALRESVEIGESTATAEGPRFAALAQLCERVPVAELHTVLGEDLRPLLASALLSSSDAQDPAPHVPV